MPVMLLTTPILPEGWKIKRVLPMMQYTGVVQVSQKSMFQGYKDRNRNEWIEVLQAFEATAHSEANAVIGIQVSTATQAYTDATFLYITYIGTPVIIEFPV